MPTDHFARLRQPRAIWMNLEALKSVYLALAAEQHPDKAGDPPAFAEVNEAHRVLSDPALSLRHWLELEAPSALAGPPVIPPAMGDAFMRIATLRRAVDAFTKQQAGVTTPLAQALLASEHFALHRDVERELVELEAARERVLNAARQVDAEWQAQEKSPTRSAQVAPQVLLLQQELTYVDKWATQLREALFQMQHGA